EVPRLLMAASPAEAPADAHTPVVVRAFAATADGKPDGSVALVNVPSHAVAPGIAVGEIPGRRELGTRKIAARAGGNTREVMIRWVTGPPATIEADARSGDNGTFIVTARVVDGGAHPVAAPLLAHADSGVLDTTEAAGGALETRYRPQRPDDPGVIVLTAGTVERRLVIEPGRRGLRWVARGVSTANLAHVFAVGALVGAEGPVGTRVSLLG